MLPKPTGVFLKHWTMAADGVIGIPQSGTVVSVKRLRFGLRHFTVALLATFLIVAPFVRRHGTLPEYGIIVAAWSAVCLTILSIAFALSGRGRMPSATQDRAVFLLTVIAALAAASGLSSGANAQDVAGDFLPFPALFAFYAVGRWAFSSEGMPAVRRLAVLLLASYVANAVISLLEFTLLGVGATHGFRLGGLLLPRLNPGFMPTLIFFLGLLLTRSKDRSLAAAGLTASVLLIILSLGRSHWVGIVAALPLGVFAVRGRVVHMAKRYARGLLIILFSVLASLLLATATSKVPIDELLAARAAGTARLEAEDIATRFVEFRDGARVALQNPLGIGLGGRIYTYVAGVGLSWTNYLHNSFLEVWLKMGIPGLALLLFVLFMSLKQSYALYRLTNQPVFLAVLLGLFAIYVGTNFSPYANKIFGTAFLGLVLGTLQTDYDHVEQSANGR